MWGGAFWAIKHPPLPTVAGWSQIQRWVSSFYTEVVRKISRFVTLRSLRAFSLLHVGPHEVPSFASLYFSLEGQDRDVVEREAAS